MLRGWWENGELGCPVTSSADMTVDVDLGTARSPVLAFSHAGGASTNDTLRIMVSTSRGAIWDQALVLNSPGETLQLEHFEPVVVDLEPWVGQRTVRFGFEFTNVCGDPFGVLWYINDVSICDQE